MPLLQTVPLFDHASISGDVVESRTMAGSNGDLESREFKFEDFFKRSQGVFKLSFSLYGEPGDTIAVKAQFFDGGKLLWTTSELSLRAATALSNTETGYTKRIDIMNSFRDYIPFEKVRFVFTKAGDENGAAIIKGRLVIF